MHWHWVVYSLVTQGCLSPLVEDLDEDVDKPGGEAATTLLLLVVGHHLLLLLHGGGRLQQALSLLRLAQPLEHTVLQLSAPHSLQRQNSHHVLNCRSSNKGSVHVICRVSFLLLPIFKITKMKNESQPTMRNSSLLAERVFFFHFGREHGQEQSRSTPLEKFEFSHQVVEGGVHGVQVVAALPVLDSLHSRILGVEAFVQVLENLVGKSLCLRSNMKLSHLIYELGGCGKFWADPQLILHRGSQFAFLVKILINNV